VKRLRGFSAYVPSVLSHEANRRIGYKKGARATILESAGICTGRRTIVVLENETPRRTRWTRSGILSACPDLPGGRHNYIPLRLSSRRSRNSVVHTQPPFPANPYEQRCLSLLC
jgi:hypothetical protein